MSDPAPPVAATQPAAMVRALLIANSEPRVAAVAAAFAEVADNTTVELSCVAELAKATTRLHDGAADVVLLGLPLAPHPGLRPLVELQAAAPSVPVVVVCAAADEPLALRAVQLGARDYLLVERLYGTLLVRSLQHAVESERTRTLVAARQHEWAPLLGGGDGPRRAATLQAALPDRFGELATAYGALLDRAVDLALGAAQESLDEPMQALAQQAAELRASPRDVIEIHAAAMKAREPAQGAQRMKLYVAEGRVRLLELMGYLASTYRALWLGGRRGS
jgi:CheY-like chemotaxis protein